MSQQLIEKIEQGNISDLHAKQKAAEDDGKKSQPDPVGEHQFDIGDTVDVHTRILEGSKERIQVFNGTVIARSGRGNSEMFSVRRIVAGEGVERKFPVNSPKIAKIVVKRSSVVRRAKLYFLRDRVGKAVRLKERRK
ncbi:MAG: 50S ribosomal protein L19 [Pirellulaceae bacterium]|jgi:large subunit ribosomal protein L19|nr:50S ribosomal protein L19 [Pirellulaceae bacterium]